MITSIVLTGGGSSRLGMDKALALVGGKGLMQRVIERLAPISDKILVVGPLYHFSAPPGCIIESKEDLFPGKGPLGGVYTGLAASKSPYNIVVACDMPFLNTALLRYIIKLSPGFDAVVPRAEKGIEPLHAVYSKSCLSAIETQLDNQLKITRFLNTANVRYVEQSECQIFDPQLLSFFNINSQADLAQANVLAVRGYPSHAFPRKE